MDLIVKPTAAEPSTPVMPATGREHLATVLFGLWMTAGLFLDGYFHQNLDGDGESFLTPWHGVFYSGFAATAWWLVTMSRHRDRRVDWRLASLPPGYGGARVGLALFALGGIGDSAWHSIFGVERGIDALLSPTHLLLFAGLLLLLTSPARAARATDAPPGPWMVAGSIISATALVAFFANFVWGLGIGALVRVDYDPVTDGGETAVIAGVGSMLVTTAVLFVASRALLALGPVPTGAIAALFAGVALLVSAAFDEDIEGVAAAAVAGVLFDALARRRHRPAVAFGLAAAALWFGYLGLLAIDGIEWQPELWAGAVVLNTLLATAIALPRLQPSQERGAPA